MLGGDISLQKKIELQGETQQARVGIFFIKKKANLLTVKDPFKVFFFIVESTSRLCYKTCPYSITHSTQH
jgi:hypothetical protein